MHQLYYLASFNVIQSLPVTSAATREASRAKVTKSTTLLAMMTV